MSPIDHIDFTAPAVLKKFPSMNGNRAIEADWPDPYILQDGTLEECIRALMAKPPSTRHLYELHTKPQGDLITAVMSADHMVEIARLRDFL
jgi:hypothetical protein